jgi:hypothetical protein
MRLGDALRDPDRESSGPTFLPPQEATMKKLRLNLDKLAVETFAPVADAMTERGTVEAMGHTRELYCTKADTCRDTSCLGGPQCTCPV